FRFLDKKGYSNRTFEIGVMRLAEKLPIHDAYPSQVKRRLDEAHQELLDRGFLADVHYDRKRDGDEKIVYTFARSRALPPEPAPLPANPLVEALEARGVTRAVAEDLVLSHDPEHIQKHLDAFDRLRAADSARIRRNPAGYLRRAIEQDYALSEEGAAKPAGKRASASRKRQRPQPKQDTPEDAVEAAGDVARKALRDGVSAERIEELRMKARQIVHERYPVLAQRPAGPAFEVMVEACVDQILAENVAEAKAE
ncbi:MAG TPA: hypothetical protein VHR86_08695, partial [Armatimonadota bacterium]|nr:hypothetical protein [Armatimonadota bacterium]